MRRANSNTSLKDVAPILEEIKLDLISENHVEENAAKRKEISRTFICESDKVSLQNEWRALTWT
jgi:hypothetical protein